MQARYYGRGDLVFVGFATQRDASHKPICPSGVDNKYGFIPLLVLCLFDFPCRQVCGHIYIIVLTVSALTFCKYVNLYSMLQITLYVDFIHVAYQRNFLAACLCRIHMHINGYAACRYIILP
jgi:hypothetical protein